MRSTVNTGHGNYASIYHNGVAMGETRFGTSYWTGHGGMISTGGREVMLRAEQSDTLYLGTDSMEDHLYDINICYEFVNF